MLVIGTTRPVQLLLRCRFWRIDQHDLWRHADHKHKQLQQSLAAGAALGKLAIRNHYELMPRLSFGSSGNLRAVFLFSVFNRQ